MDGNIYFIGKRFLNYENLYDLNGLHSATLGIVVVNRLSEVLEGWPFNYVIFKAMKIPVIYNSISNIESFGIVSRMNFYL
ncbi:Uncharacterized protein APZ42_031159 [Daphnia magna]|uniref:Uncharacterized protein n=1 Tax=Daphnia magna TaxID=35525 RepID=A0A164N450_9CRUS|nr:Uncharacterized protein APZ42_031159 [Daphnia magna]